MCFATKPYTGFVSDELDNCTTEALLTEIQTCNPTLLVAYPHFMLLLYRYVR